MSKDIINNNEDYFSKNNKSGLFVSYYTVIDNWSAYSNTTVPILFYVMNNILDVCLYLFPTGKFGKSKHISVEIHQTNGMRTYTDKKKAVISYELIVNHIKYVRHNINFNSDGILIELTELTSNLNITILDISFKLILHSVENKPNINFSPLKTITFEKSLIDLSEEFIAPICNLGQYALNFKNVKNQSGNMGTYIGFLMKDLELIKSDNCNITIGFVIKICCIPTNKVYVSSYSYITLNNTMIDWGFVNLLKDVHSRIGYLSKHQTKVTVEIDIFDTNMKIFSESLKKDPKNNIKNHLKNHLGKNWKNNFIFNEQSQEYIVVVDI
jgi:hypothetical protein